MACRAAVLASGRPDHQPISRNDIMPTPSQPINSWYMLLAVIMVSIVIRKIVRYLINLLMFGSEDMYQIENSMMDHVMNRAIGVNIIDKVSMYIVTGMFSVVVRIRGVKDIVSSELLYIRWLSGIRLTKNSNMSLFLVLVGK